MAVYVSSSFSPFSRFLPNSKTKMWMVPRLLLLPPPSSSLGLGSHSILGYPISVLHWFLLHRKKSPSRPEEGVLWWMDASNLEHRKHSLAQHTPLRPKAVLQLGVILWYLFSDNPVLCRSPPSFLCIMISCTYLKESLCDVMAPLC